MATDFTATITGWYQAVQYRTPPANDLAVYNAALNSGALTQAQVQAGIENDIYTANFVNPVIREYQAAFGRVPDQAGVKSWVGQLAAGTITTAQLGTIFANSAEFNARYGATATTIATPSLVTSLYTNVLGRTPDQAGLTYWQNSGLNAAQLLNAFAQSGEFVSNTAGAVVAFQNLEIAGTPPTTGSLFSVPGAPPVGTSVFTLTQSLDSFSTTGTGAVFNAVPVTTPLGLVLQTLTVGDNLQDTAGDGTLNYTPTAAGVVAGVTFNGIATANITNLGGAVGFNGNVAGLTTVNVTSTSLPGAGNTVALGAGGGLGLATALKTVNINANEAFTGTIAAAAVSGTTDAISVNLTGTYGAAAAANILSFVNDGAAGTKATPQNVYEIENISASGKSYAQLTAVGGNVLSTTTLNLSGAGLLTLSAGAAGDFQKVTTINASTDTGGVTITGALGIDAQLKAVTFGLLAGNTALTSFTGGTGSNFLDVSNYTATQLAALTANGGTGTGVTNTIVVADAVASSATAVMPTVTNFNNLGIAGLNTATGAATTYNLSNVPSSINTVTEYAAAGAFVATFKNAPSTFSLVDNFFDGGAGLTIGRPASDTSTTDVFNQTIATGTVSDAVGVETVNGFETMNLVVNTGGAGASTMTSLTMTPTAAAADALNISGTGAFTVGLVTMNGVSNTITDTDTGVVTIAGTNANVINAATSGGLIMTAADTFVLGSIGGTITGSATKANVLIGSAGNNTFTAGANVAGDTIVTGGGADIVSLGTHAGTDHVELYAGGGAAAAGVVTATAGSITAGATDIAQVGFWGIGASGAPATIAALVALFPATSPLGTSASQAVVSGFVATGSNLVATAGAANDVVDISVGAWTKVGVAQGLVAGNLATAPVSSAAGTNAVIQNVLSGGTVGATTSIVELGSATFANANAVASALKSGSYTITFGGANVAGNNEHILVAYSDGSNMHIADLDVSGAATALSTGLTLAASDMVQLTGVSLASFNASNVHFVA